MPTLELAVNALRTVYNTLNSVPTNAVVVLDFYDAPEELQAFSENGGDEDYILIHSTREVHWSSLLTVCNEDTYHLGIFRGIHCYITITAHA